MADVDVTDILLAIARQVSENLELLKISLRPRGFKNLLKDAADFLQTPIELKASIGVPGVGEITAGSEELGFSEELVKLPRQPKKVRPCGTD